MSNDVDQLLRNIASVWQAAASRGDYEALLELGFSARQIFKALKQEEAVEACLGTLHIAISHLWNDSDLQESTETAPLIQNKCSFCGRKPPDVRLGAGPGVFICNECVETFTKILSKEKI